MLLRPVVLAHTHMRKWFGRPSLKLGDILKRIDMTTDELASYLPRGARAADNLVLWPVCTSWPMGLRGPLSLRSQNSSNVVMMPV